MAAPTAIVNPMAALMAIVNPMAALRASDGHHQPNGPSDGHCNYPMVVRADACSEQPFGCSTPQWPPAQWPLTTQWLPPRRLRHSMAALSGHRGNRATKVATQVRNSTQVAKPVARLMSAQGFRSLRLEMPRSLAREGWGCPILRLHPSW
ncbi:hypothetical protein PCANC_03183 [Puccinia coronata f. sp. avenae]|uniref:Uncharacterized protein n=1 Tax=Puccinia coronata f. sp. avenae TaxID=200324 RepID=A0A2N5T822_9BASI|nr:hypothetical protein PCANC_03183 [Puccinia coronata f. sp. avenae]